MFCLGFEKRQFVIFQMLIVVISSITSISPNRTKPMLCEAFLLIIKFKYMSKIKEFFKVLFCSHEYRVARFDHRFEQCKKCQYIKNTSIYTKT